MATAAEVEAFETALLALDRGALERQLEQLGHELARIEPLVAGALERLGRRWERGEASLSQIYMAGKLCEELVARALPTEARVGGAGPKLGIVVLEDHHALGKRIVHACLRAAGFDVEDLGQGRTVDEIVAACRASRLQLVLVSTLMLPAALRVAELVRRLRAEGLTTRVVVGGAPFLLDEELFREVGADAMGRSAADAVALARRFTGTGP